LSAIGLIGRRAMSSTGSTGPEVAARAYHMRGKLIG
jgi:hypothetical protein